MVMQIFLNGEIKQVDENISLSQLLEMLKLPDKRIAVELNRLVIRRGDWHATAVEPNDKIEVIHFVGGG